MSYTTEHPPKLMAVIDRLPVTFRAGKMPYVFLFVILVVMILLLYASVSPIEYAGLRYVVMAAFLLFLLGLLHLGMPVEIGVHIGTAAGVVLMVTTVWSAGGIFSPFMAWMMILPLTPFYVIGRRAGTAWLLMVFGVQITMALLSYHGMVPEFQMGMQHAWSSWLTFTLVTGVLIIVPAVYDRLYQQALTQGLHDQQALEGKRLELEHTLKTRAHFVATISHELRTPMNAILGFNALLLAQLEGKPQARKVLKHTQQSADHLMTVINDILDYSQLQAGQLVIHTETFKLHETVEHAFQLFWPRVKSMDIAYRLEIDAGLPEWVHTDRHRLMQVLVNFLGNALKFTHQGSVVLQVQWQNPGVMFAVKDTGIGIAKDRQAQIFNRFSQADRDTQTLYGGNGLGLAISRTLVLLLGGEIGFESETGKGSRFWFSLPLNASDAPEQTGTIARSEVQTADRSWSFLIVDDHPVNRLLVKQVLKNAWPKCHVADAANGQEALDKMRTQSFDLVLMDMVMPVMDGIAATRKLRDEWPAPAKFVPVLGLTANVNPGDLNAFQTAGLSDVMLKPFEPAQLCVRVEQLLLRRF